MQPVEPSRPSHPRASRAVAPADARPIGPTNAGVAGRRLHTVAAFGVAALGMLTYEAVKSVLFPALSLWQSHAITIGVGAVTAATVANLAMRRQSAVDRRLAESHARHAALVASEASYRALVDASPEAVAVHRDGRLLYANVAAHRLLGVSDHHDLAGRAIADFVHPDDRARLPTGAPERLATTNERHHAAYRLVRPDGTMVEVEAASVALQYDGGAAVQSVLHDVTERKRLESELVRQALHDALTGLANRALFRDRVTHALARTGREAAARCSVAVLFIDLDGFKAVNDGLGHAAGDELLAIAARRLLSATRGSDTVARLGGDEFAVLLEGLHDAGEALPVVARVCDALRRPVVIEGREITVPASVGLAHATPGDDADALVRHADVAMYQAKAAGKGRHAVFEPAMYAAVRERFELEGALRGAVDDPAAHGFHLVYQPVVDLATGTVRSAEALLRWTRDGSAAVSPAVFVPVAEESGLIIPLGRWVLAEACAQLAAWQARWVPDRWNAAGAPGVAVNISGRQLEVPGFAADVADILARTGVPTGAVTLEITESVLMQDARATLVTLEALKALGVRLAIDDFGTGYSSLSYLQRFPVDVLKIDKSFVDRVARGGPEAALARTVVALGETLGVRTVAEGIEDGAQRDALRALGCDLGQGFLFARPMAADAVFAFARDTAAAPPAPRRSA